MTIYNLLAAGKLRARKLGNRTLIDAGDVRLYFETLPAYRAIKP
jgi:excisionase family DNA binding protein